MRFNKRITFVKETGGGYNTNTGLHDKPVLVKEVKPCNISVLGTMRSKQLYGETDKNTVIARLQQPYEKPFDYVEICDKPFKLRQQSVYRKQALFLELV